MKKLMIAITLLVLMIITQSCEMSKRDAFGEEDELIVLTDSATYAELEETLKMVFEKEIITPQPEKLFKLRRVNLDEFEATYKNRKNILILNSLTANTVYADYMKDMLDSSIQVMMSEGNISYVSKESIWAKGQYVVVMARDNLQEIEAQLTLNAENLLYAYQSVSDKRLMKAVYNPLYEREDAQGHLLKEYGWMMFVQVDFVLARDLPQEQFVWMRRGVNTAIEKWIFVAWWDSLGPEYLNQDSIMMLRNKLTEQHYRSANDQYYVEIAPQEVISREENFNGRYAIFLQGLWRMTDRFMGGPFVNYTFLDEKQNRLYMLDGSIFAPKYEKRNLIQQTDVLLKSFVTINEVEEERKKQLFEAAEEYSSWKEDLPKEEKPTE